MSKDLLAIALEQTKANVSKPRGASGRKAYIDRIVSCLLDEDGNPVEGKTRHEIIAEVSLEIVMEQREAALESGAEGVTEFDFDNEDDQAEFAKVNKKVKAQVAAAVSDSNNATAISYNEKYKDTWAVEKTGSGSMQKISLVSLESAE